MQNAKCAKIFSGTLHASVHKVIEYSLICSLLKMLVRSH